jgi:two-component system cell cycle sensor histidine kinase/response regulator CckA
VSTTRWRSLLEEVFSVLDRGDGISLTDRELRRVYVSPAVTRMLGWTPEELCSGALRDLTHPDDVPRIRQASAELFNEPGGERTFLARTRHKDGRWRWVESTTVNLLEDPDVAALVTHYRDVTDAVVAREALDDARRRFESLLSATSAVTYTCKTTPPYAATFISENVEAMLGHPARAFLDDPSFWKDHIHPDDRDAVFADLAGIFESGRNVREYRLRRGDGTYAWVQDDHVLVHENGAPKELIGFALDVTKRHEMETALRRSEANFRVLIESAPICVFVHRDDKIIYVNPALAKLLRVEPDELVGQSPLAITPENRRELARARIETVSKGPTYAQSPRIESELLRSDGTMVPVEIEGVKLHFDGILSHVVCPHDISDRRAMLTRLAASDRLASLGVLAAGVAHEINNPLAFLQTNVVLLADRLGSNDDPEVAAMLRDVREGATRIAALVRDLRSFARPDVEQMSAVDVRDVIESCARMARNEIASRARLVMSIGDVPPVAASASRLGQVILNLLINAAQSIPDGNPAENEVKITACRAASGRVVIEVSDTGIGIAPDVLGHVFDPFFTTKPLGSGTGLGLSICHGIVKGFGGDITVESRVGHGSTFRVELPAWSSSRKSHDPKRDTQSVPLKGLRILVVDDERAMGESLRLLLSRDHDVIALTSAREALARIETGFRCDVLLCDLMMPDVTGMDFYDTLSRDFPDLASRMVFLTGGAFTPSSQQFLERVPNPRLEKPFELDALHAALATVIKNTKPAAP